MYLPIIRALIEGMNLFLLIPQADQTKFADLKLSLDAQNAIAAKDLIASRSVISAVNVAAEQLAQGLMELTALKVEELKLSIELDYTKTRIDELNTKNRQIVDRVKALLETGPPNQETLKELNSQFESNQSELQPLFTEQNERFVKKSDLLKELQLQAMKGIVKMSAVTARAVIAIREDLGIPTDELMILRHYRESVKFVEKVFPEFIEEVWGKINSTRL